MCKTCENKPEEKQNNKGIKKQLISPEEEKEYIKYLYNWHTQVHG